jgi:tryptophan-rich sensory protein
MTYLILVIIATILFVLIPIGIMIVFNKKSRQEMKTILGIYFLSTAFIFVTVLSLFNLM